MRIFDLLGFNESPLQQTLKVKRPVGDIAMDEKASFSSRVEAMIYLGTSDDPKAITPLQKCCLDESPAIRAWGVDLLGELVCEIPVTKDSIQEDENGFNIKKGTSVNENELRVISALNLFKHISKTDKDPLVKETTQKALEKFKTNNNTKSIDTPIKYPIYGFSLYTEVENIDLKKLQDSPWNILNTEDIPPLLDEDHNQDALK